MKRRPCSGPSASSELGASLKVHLGHHYVGAAALERAESEIADAGTQEDRIDNLRACSVRFDA